MDDILIFYEGARSTVDKFKNILELFFKDTSMITNLDQSTISMW
jgi:hypothetical protein